MVYFSCPSMAASISSWSRTDWGAVGRGCFPNGHSLPSGRVDAGEKHRADPHAAAQGPQWCVFG